MWVEALYVLRWGHRQRQVSSSPFLLAQSTAGFKAPSDGHAVIKGPITAFALESDRFWFCAPCARWATEVSFYVCAQLMLNQFPLVSGFHGEGVRPILNFLAPRVSAHLGGLNYPRTECAGNKGADEANAVKTWHAKSFPTTTVAWVLVLRAVCF